ncbi:hypothetical protein PR048_021550 [Dryococelus australis]|uniref:Uncharacterized protein n=1 Tax=Dryococelus australis TaxID=614101 RepID=A0ABQ9GYJ8_9NEOP|nr:hypothetical protein PR048_021550 [Dryococelus australis]
MYQMYLEMYEVDMYHQPGHSFLPCDRHFGHIEKNIRKKNRQDIYFIPQQYKTLVKNTSPKKCSYKKGRAQRM